MKTALNADRFRTWSFVAALAVIALSSLWLLEVMRHNATQGDNDQLNRSEPDYYVEHFDYIRLSNKEEKDNYHLTGEKLTHHPNKDNFEITNPLINSFSDDNTPIAIRAEKAIIEQKTSPNHPPRDSDEIHLYGNVIVERPQSAKNNYMRLNSEYLLFLPDLDIMRTDKPVTLTSPTSVTHAIGMEANNSTQVVSLLSQITITSHPKSNIEHGTP